MDHRAESHGCCSGQVLPQEASPTASIPKGGHWREVKMEVLQARKGYMLSSNRVILQSCLYSHQSSGTPFFDSNGKINEEVSDPT